MSPGELYSLFRLYVITTPLPLIQYMQGECVFKYLNAGLNIELCSGDVCGLVSGVETAAVSPGIVYPRSALSSPAMTHTLVLLLQHALSWIAMLQAPPSVWNQCPEQFALELPCALPGHTCMAPPERDICSPGVRGTGGGNGSA